MTSRTKWIFRCTVLIVAAISMMAILNLTGSSLDQYEDNRQVTGLTDDAEVDQVDEYTEIRVTSAEGPNGRRHSMSGQSAGPPGEPPNVLTRIEIHKALAQLSDYKPQFERRGRIVYTNNNGQEIQHNNIKQSNEGHDSVDTSVNSKDGGLNEDDLKLQPTSTILSSSISPSSELGAGTNLELDDDDPKTTGSSTTDEGIDYDGKDKHGHASSTTDKNIDTVIKNQQKYRSSTKNILEKDSVDTQQDDSDHILILLWSRFHDSGWWKVVGDYNLDCECDCKCLFSKDRAKFNKSDALMFDIRLTDKDKTSFQMVPKHHPPNQYWILFNSEFLKKGRYKMDSMKPGIFNLSASYSLQSDIHLPYGECKKRPASSKPVGDRILYSKDKNGMVSWLVSSCITPSRRMAYAATLSKYVNVNIQGLCGRNKDSFSKRKESFYGKGTVSDQTLSFMNEHKFYLSFENTFCKDYVTEKTFKVLMEDIRTVPIVRGWANYTRILPPKSFIDTADFKSPKELADYLKMLDENDELYEEYFKWRDTHVCRSLYQDITTWPCRVCQHLCKLKTNKQKKFKDTFEEFQSDTACFYAGSHDKVPPRIP